MKHSAHVHSKIPRAVGGALSFMVAGTCCAQASGSSTVADAASSNAAAAALAPSASASAAAPAQLGAVVVTAQKREQKLQEVPVAITVLGGDALQKADEIKTANDITQFIPNAQAASTDGRTRPRWFLRGIGTNETAASTVSPIGIYTDDVYLNNVYLQGFPLFDTERVEVLRGPQGTLWGKNTTGGAINYISRKPTFTDDGYARIGIGSNNEEIFQGAVGGGLVTDRVAGRISFYDEKRDGWVDNLATDRKDGALKDQAVRAQLMFLVSDDVDALLSVRSRHLDGDKSPSFYVLDPTQPVKNPLYAGPLTGRDSIAQAGRSEEVYDSDGATLHVNWDIGRYQVTSITAYDAGKRVLWGGSPIELDISRTRELSNSHQTTQELRLTSPQEDRLNWILGAYYFKEGLFDSSVVRKDAVAGASPTSASPTAKSPFGFNITEYEQQTTSSALFGNATFKFTDRWSLTGGLRKSFEKKDYSLDYSAAPNSASFNNNVSAWWLPDSVTALNPTQASQEAHSWSELTYDLTPQWKVNDNVNVYLRYAHGFRAGGFVVSPTNTITRLEPETLDATELGVKTQWLDGRLTLNTALFNYDYKNIIVGVLLPIPGTTSTLQVQENAAAGFSRGAEFELTYYPTQNWRVGASLGLLDTRYQSYSSTASGQTIDATGNRFTRSPKISSSLDLQYSVPIASGAAIGAGTDWSWRSLQYFNAVNQTDPTLDQGAYALGNARIFYRAPGGRLEIGAFVRNVTDKVYSVLATGPSAGSTREVYGLPRTYGVTLDWKFL